MTYYVMVRSGGEYVAAEIEDREFQGDKRTQAAAQLLVGHGVKQCEVTQTYDNGKSGVIWLFPVDRMYRGGITLQESRPERAEVKRAIQTCNRKITSHDVDAFFDRLKSLLQPASVQKAASRPKASSPPIAAGKPVQLQLFA